MKYVAALSMIFLIAEGTAVAESKNWSAEVEAVAEKCGIPPKNLRFVNGSVRWIKPEKASYDQVMCVIDELKARGVPMQQGYVLNGR
jgi:hypothetical protein